MNRSSALSPLEQLDPARFETPTILKRLVAAHRALAEFKGVAASMPNQNILLSILGLQESKDTTHDELFSEALHDTTTSPAAKEVARYNRALRIGFAAVQHSGLLTSNHIVDIQTELEQRSAAQAFAKCRGQCSRATPGA